MAGARTVDSATRRDTRQSARASLVPLRVWIKRHISDSAGNETFKTFKEFFRLCNRYTERVTRGLRPAHLGHIVAQRCPYDMVRHGGHTRAAEAVPFGARGPYP